MLALPVLFVMHALKSNIFCYIPAHLKKEGNARESNLLEKTASRKNYNFVEKGGDFLWKMVYTTYTAKFRSTKQRLTYTGRI